MLQDKDYETNDDDSREEANYDAAIPFQPGVHGNPFSCIDEARKRAYYLSPPTVNTLGLHRGHLTCVRE